MTISRLFLAFKTPKKQFVSRPVNGNLIAATIVRPYVAFHVMKLNVKSFVKSHAREVTPAKTAAILVHLVVTVR